MSYPLDRLPLLSPDDESADRRERYEKRHDPEAFLDLFYPGWEKNRSQWPPRPVKTCPCEM